MRHYTKHCMSINDIKTANVGMSNVHVRRWCPAVWYGTRGTHVRMCQLASAELRCDSEMRSAALCVSDAFEYLGRAKVYAKLLNATSRLYPVL